VSLIAGIALRLSAALVEEPWTRCVGVAAYLRATVNKIEADVRRAAAPEGPSHAQRLQPRGQMSRGERESFAAYGIELRAALNVLSLQYPFFILYLEKLNLEVWNTQMLPEPKLAWSGSYRTGSWTRASPPRIRDRGCSSSISWPHRAALSGTYASTG
jgi:hypothetical protein